jgi:hypothetical protein
MADPAEEGASAQHGDARSGRRAIKVLAGMVAASIIATLIAYGSRSDHRAPTLPQDQCPAEAASHSDRPAIGPLPLPMTFDGGALIVRDLSDSPAPAVPRAQALVDFETTAEVAGVHSCVGFGLASVSLKSRRGLSPRINRLTWVGIAHSESAQCPGGQLRGSLASVAVPVDVVLIDAEVRDVVDVYASGGISCDGTSYPPTLTAARQVISIPFDMTIKGGAYYVSYVEPACTGHGTVQSDGPLAKAVTEIDVQIPFGGCSSVDPQTAASPRAQAGQVHAPTGPTIVLET